MLPFAAGMAALAMAIGVGSVLAARGAANDELDARADRAEDLARDTLARTRERLAGDSLLLGRLLTEPGTATQLENRVVQISVERDLSHVSLLDRRGRVIGGDGRADWAKLPLAGELRRRAATRSPASASAVSAGGEPMILAVSSVRTPDGPRAIMLGRAIDRELLAPVERSLGVLFHLETETASGESPRRAGSLQDDGTRTVAKPLELSDPEGGRARLLVSMSSRRLSAATWSILMVTGGAGVLVLMVLLGFLQALLGKSVVSPVRKLAGYPYPRAYAVTDESSSQEGMASATAPAGGLAVWSEKRPSSVYLAYPGSELLVEVYSPKASEARRLVLDGEVGPVDSKAAGTQAPPPLVPPFDLRP